MLHSLDNNKKLRASNWLCQVYYILRDHLLNRD